MRIRERLNRFVYEEFDMGEHELDIKFKVFGRKYRIPQFCKLWFVLQTVLVVSFGLIVYMLSVCALLLGGMIGGM